MRSARPETWLLLQERRNLSNSFENGNATVQPIKQNRNILEQKGIDKFEAKLQTRELTGREFGAGVSA